jgi:hypothetical protein
MNRSKSLYCFIRANHAAMVPYYEWHVFSWQNGCVHESTWYIPIDTFWGQNRITETES